MSRQAVAPAPPLSSPLLPMGMSPNQLDRHDARGKAPALGDLGHLMEHRPLLSGLVRCSSLAIHQASDTRTPVRSLKKGSVLQ